uniref:WD_REPEATS_REGION domain-containing protein n=1 Tax=Rodentolepis nana TaxID=102285 RepID=A0A0R3TYJ0_RODNA
LSTLINELPFLLFDITQTANFITSRNKENFHIYLTLGKKAGCLVFSPTEQSILLGEKSGHVFNIAIDVLGHLSLLTSVVVSNDGRYIGTCDRDEKIRISRFSQPYVLESFCLGH